MISGLIFNAVVLPSFSLFLYAPLVMLIRVLVAAPSSLKFYFATA